MSGQRRVTTKTVGISPHGTTVEKNRCVYQTKHGDLALIFAGYSTLPIQISTTSQSKPAISHIRADSNYVDSFRLHPDVPESRSSRVLIHAPEHLSTAISI